MNRSNFGASFDIVHVLIDVLVLFFSFFIAYSVFDNDFSTMEEWIAFVTIYLVCILIFLLGNRTQYIYNNTIFFYRDRIIKRETLSFILALVCGGFLYHFSADLLLYRRGSRSDTVSGRQSRG